MGDIDYEEFRIHLLKVRSSNCKVDNWVDSLKLRREGLTYKQIGERLSCTSVTARLTVIKATKAYNKYQLIKGRDER